MKKDNYDFYKNEVQEIPSLRILDFKDSIRPNYWFYALYVEQGYALNRDQIIKYLSTKKIQARPIWGLIRDQKPCEGSQTYKIDKAKQYLDKVINIACSSNLSREDAACVIECLNNQRWFRLPLKRGAKMEVIEFLIDEESKMLEAMQQLDEVAKKILFVTRDGHFAAAITDVTSEDKSQIPVRGREKQNKRVYKKHSNAALPLLDKYLTKKITS